MRVLWLVRAGVAFSIGILGAGAQVNAEQVKSLADEAAGRIR